MARRKSDSPQKAALREIMSNYLKENDVHIKDGTDVNSIMRDMMSICPAEKMFWACTLGKTRAQNSGFPS